jgi:hypothetical protein
MSVALRYSQYPIGRLLLRVLGDSGLRPGAFMQSLGYRKINTGTAAFDEWVSQGAGHADFITRLQASRFAVPAGEMQVALDDSAAMIRAEHERVQAAMEARARAEFRPYVRAVPELSRPTWITGFALTGGWSRDTAAMPAGFEEWDAARQEAAIAEAVQLHYASSDGRTRFMGAILRYQFFGEYGAAPVYYSIDGVPEPDGSPAPATIGEVVLRVGTDTFTVSVRGDERTGA